MVKINADFHVHTHLSDGKSSLEENIEAARQKGILRLGIADHGPGHQFYGITLEQFRDLRRAVDAHNDRGESPRLYLGIEGNLLGTDGGLDIDDAWRETADYIMAGYHFGSKIRRPADLGLHLVNALARKLPFLRKLSRRMNTRMLVNAVERHRIDVLTHPGAKGAIDVVAVADACAASGTIMEVNGARHGYLRAEDLALLVDHPVKLILGSDAHLAVGIGDFDSALHRVQEAGISTDRLQNHVFLKGEES